MTTCRCGSTPISLEVKTAGKNRGRWYLKCPTGTCAFFMWDESPFPFIKHPEHAYASILPLSEQRINSINKFRAKQNKDYETSLTKTKVQVAFSVISKELIGIKAQDNLTLNPVIASIEHIKWSEEYGQWTIPASIPMYNLAIASLPTDTPNLQIEIEPIPPALLDSIIKNTFLATNVGQRDLSELSYIESKWTDFVGSNTWKKLNSSIQRDAVRIGIERNCRILLGNENGIGSIPEALALTKIYEEEWPVLVTCPAILCETWKQEIINFIGLSDENICILDPKLPRSEAFKPQITLKRKRLQKKPKARLPYHKRMQLRFQGRYESSSNSSSEEENEEENEEVVVEEIRMIKNIKFYIASHEHTAKCRNEIRKQKFKIMLCADSHYLKSWTKGESKFICTLLQDHQKVILISDTARNCLPVNMYTQLQAVSPVMFPKFEEFAKRYCDPKSTVFGWNNNGRCNQHEFTYLLDNNIWYCPRLNELKADFPDYVRQNVTLNVKNNDILKKQIDNLMDMDISHDIEERISLIELLHKKTGEAKIECINEYLDYVFETYKRPKIALIYRNDVTFKSIEHHLTSKKIRFSNLNTTDAANDKCELFNKSNSVQIILMDMSLEKLDVSLYSVDLLIFAELPTEMAKLFEMESFFKHNDRTGPLSVKYLMAPKTIDDYLWPLIRQ